VAEIRWIKIVTDVFDDEKILLIESLPDADSLIVIWFKLLCLGGKQNNSGVFMMNNGMAYTDEMFSNIFRRPLNTVRLALSTFEKYGMIEVVNNSVVIPNWSKHQNFDRIEKNNDYQRKYMQDYRAKQKAIATDKVCKPNSKPNHKPNVRPLEENRKEENRVEKKRVEKNIKELPYPLDEFDFSHIIQSKVKEWVAYKNEKKDSYKDIGFKALLNIISKNINTYGDEHVINVIDESMSNGWKGIAWDKLNKCNPKKSNNNDWKFTDIN